MARWAAREIWPPHLARYDPAEWPDRLAWATARWDHYRAHPELEHMVDAIALLRDRYLARHEVVFGAPEPA